MSDSQKFPVAAHALAYLAHKGANSPAQAVPSAILAASIPTNPVVVRRVTALLAKAEAAKGAPAGPEALVPVAPPAAPVRRMTAKAGGHSYETLISGGWTDATLVQHGLMEV